VKIICKWAMLMVRKRRTATDMRPKIWFCKTCVAQIWFGKVCVALGTKSDDLNEDA
jgi:hypothetical protein